MVPETDLMMMQILSSVGLILPSVLTAGHRPRTPGSCCRSGFYFNKELERNKKLRKLNWEIPKYTSRLPISPSVSLSARLSDFLLVSLQVRSVWWPHQYDYRNMLLESIMKTSVRVQKVIIWSWFWETGWACTSYWVDEYRTRFLPVNILSLQMRCSSEVLDGPTDCRTVPAHISSVCCRFPAAAPAAACRPAPWAERLPGFCQRPVRHRLPKTQQLGAGTPPCWWVWAQCNSTGRQVFLMCFCWSEVTWRKLFGLNRIQKSQISLQLFHTGHKP